VIRANVSSNVDQGLTYATSTFTPPKRSWFESKNY
jgi:hypothetical protein